MNGIIIIPAYNPDGQLAVLAKAMCEMENLVVVVDDGSQEEYLKYFDTLEDEVILLRHEQNRGKGAAIRTALAFIKEKLRDKDPIGIMDADGQHRPEDMEKVLLAARRHPHTLVLGVREVGEAMPLRSRLGNTLTRKVFRLVSGVAVSDTQTGLRAFDQSLLERMLAVSGDRYEYETNVLLTAARAGIPIEEVKIQTIYRDSGNSTSHFHAVRDSLRIYRELLAAMPTFLTLRSGSIPRHRLGQFAFSSFSSFVLDYALFSGLMLVLPHTAGMIFAGNVCARILSASYNYYMNCRFVFHEKRKLSTAIRYFCLAGGILALNVGLLEGLTQVIGLPVYPAKLLTEMVLFIVSFLVQDKVIFKNKRKCSEVQNVMDNRAIISGKKQNCSETQCVEISQAKMIAGRETV